MRMVLAIAIVSFLMIAEQLCAQAADPFGSSGDSSAKQDDPFGPINRESTRVVPADGKPTLTPKTPKPDKNVKKAASQPALYPHVCVGQAVTMHERIEVALNRETTFDYLDQPLKDVIEDISYTNNVPIVIDTVALEDFGIDTGTPITTSLKGISLRSALRLMFRELDLTYVIRNEVLQITTPEAAAAAASTRFYQVAELLPANADGDVLVELIKKLVAPNTWCGSDHVGAIIYIEHLESLAIRQTDDVFYEIEELLAATKQIVENQRPKGRPHDRDPFD